MKTGGERIESRVETEGDRKVYNVETKENGTKKCIHSVETGKKIKIKINAQVIRGHSFRIRHGMI